MNKKMGDSSESLKNKKPLFREFIFLFLPLILMVAIHLIAKPETINYSLKDYFSNILQIIIVEASIRISSTKQYELEEFNTAYIIILLFSAMFYYGIQSNSTRELTGVFGIISLVIILIMTAAIIGMRVMEFKKRFGE